MWLRRVVKEAGIPMIDWFRLAQDRKQWRSIVDKAYPYKKLDTEQKAELDKWIPGLPLPGLLELDLADLLDAGLSASDEKEEGSDQEGGGEDQRYVCPVCEASFNTGNQLQYHYQAEHGVRNPDVITTITHKCNLCQMIFARKDQLYKHKGWKLDWRGTEPTAELCQAQMEAVDRQRSGIGADTFRISIVSLPSPQGWWIATDGSGIEVDGVRKAGWGVVIFRLPVSDNPSHCLYGPVMSNMWDHRWIGARERTNNTGELSAIIEAMLWLLQEAPDNGIEPVMLRYDSEYAAKLATGRWSPQCNQELVSEARKAVDEVMERRTITWQHVYGHTGAHDNELADRAAAKGAQGEINIQSIRWNAPPGYFNARMNIPEVKARVIKPNRAAAWAAKRAARAKVALRRPANAEAKAAPKAQAKPKAAGKAMAKGKSKAKAKAKAKSR